MFSLNIRSCLGTSSPALLDFPADNLLAFSSGQNLILKNSSSGQSTIYQGHLNKISALTKCSQDLIVSADSGPSDCCIIVWNIKTGQPVATYSNVHSGLGVKSLCSFGSLIFTLGHDSLLAVWSLDDLSFDEPLSTLQFSGEYNHISMSCDDRMLIALTGPAKVQFARLSGNRLEWIDTQAPLSEIYNHIPRFTYTRFVPPKIGIKFQGEIKPVAFSATDRGDILFWSNRHIQNLMQELGDGHISAVRSITLHQHPVTDFHFIDERYILTTGLDRKIKLYDFSFHIIQEVEKPSCGNILYMCPQTIPDEGKQLWKQTSTTCIMVMSETGGLYKIRNSGCDLECEELTRPTLAKSIVDVAYSPIEPILALALSNKSVTLWNYKQSTFFNSIELKFVPSSIKFSTSGSLLAVGSTNGAFDLVNTATLKSIVAEPVFALREAICGITFSKDDQAIALQGVEGTIGYMYNQKRIANVKAHPKPACFLEFSEDGSSLFYLSGSEQLVSIWDATPTSLTLNSKILLEQEEEPVSACWDNVNRHQMIYVTTGLKFKWFDTKAKQVVKTMAAPEINDNLSFMKIVTSGKEPYLVFGGKNGDIGLHSLPIDGNPFRYQAVRAHTKLKSIAASPDGSMIVAIGQDGMISVWDVDLSALVKQVGQFPADSLHPYLARHGGIDGEFHRKCMSMFYYAQLQLQGEDSLDVRMSTNHIPIETIPKLMRSVGYFPSDKEVDNLLRELKIEDMASKTPGLVSLEDFIKLYVNHHHVKPVELKAAVNRLKATNMDLKAFKQLLSSSGEKMDEEEFDKIIERLLRCDNDQLPAETTKVGQLLAMIRDAKAKP